jgi:hypothetical protein
MPNIVNARQYEFSDLTLLLGNRDITGFRGIKYTEKIEREAVYGKGRNPHHIQSGNISVEGEIFMLQSELETLIKAGKGSILSLAFDACISYGNPSNGDALITDYIYGIRFTESPKELKQGDKFMDVKIPFIALRVKQQV